MNRLSEVPQDPESPSFSFIKQRIEAASSETQLLVTRELLEAQGSRKALFLKLATMLRSQPSVFKSVSDLLSRDNDARTRVGGPTIQEVSRRDAIAMRPDENRPSPLEWFFLTIPSIDIATAKKDWRRLCNVVDHIPSGRQTDSGALSLQNVIQNVMSDEPRTRAFILETHERTKKIMAQLGRPPVVYDIGCGPFPVLGIAAAIASPNSPIVCIEKNPMSAEVARFMVEQLGLTNVTVVTGDALSDSTFKLRSREPVDLLITETFGPALFDEPGVQIFKKYSPLLSTEGETIPMRVTLSATLMPMNKGVTFEDGVRQEKYVDGVVLNVDGSDLPKIPESEWIKTRPSEIFLSEVPEGSQIQGTLRVPEGMSLEEFNRQDFLLCICAEFDLGNNTLQKYQSFPTFPLRLDEIHIPADFIKEAVDPQLLEIRFSFTPGESSSVTKRHAVVVKRGDRTLG